VVDQAGAELVRDEGEGPHLTAPPSTPTKGVHQVTFISLSTGVRPRCPREGALGVEKVMAGEDASRVGVLSPPEKAWMMASL